MLERIKNEMERSVSPALSGLAVDAQELLSSELQLLKREVSDESKRILRVTAGMFGVALCGIMTLAFAAVAAVQLLSERFPNLPGSGATGIVALALGLLSVGQLLYWSSASRREDTSSDAALPQRAKATLEPRVEQLAAAVERTIDAAEESVEEMKDQVKEALDPRRQFEKHPVATFGTSVAVGFVAGRLLAPSHPAYYRETILPGDFAANREVFSRLHSSGAPIQGKAISAPGRRAVRSEPSEGRFDGLRALLTGLGVALLKEAVEDALPRSMKGALQSPGSGKLSLASLVQSFFNDSVGAKSPAAGRRTPVAPQSEFARAGDGEYVLSSKPHSIPNQNDRDYVSSGAAADETASASKVATPVDAAVHRDHGWEDSLPH